MEETKAVVSCLYDADRDCHVAAYHADLPTQINVVKGFKKQLTVLCETDPVAIELLRPSKDEWQIIIVAAGKSVVYKKTLQFPTEAFSDGHIEPMDTEEKIDISDLAFENEISKTPHKEPASMSCNIPALELATDDPPFEITDDDILLSCGKDIVGVCCSEKDLVLTCLTDEGFILLVYTPVQSGLAEINSRCMQKLMLPRSSFLKQGTSRLRKSFAPKLHFVSMDEGGKFAQSSSEIILPSHLFSLLFGWETAVKSVSVLMCSLPNGEAYYHIMTSASSSTTTPLTSSTAAASSKLPWHQLCSVGSGVVDVFFVKINRSLTENELIAVQLDTGLGALAKNVSHAALDALLVVGSTGRCCLFVSVPAIASSKANYRLITVLFSIPSCITCACFLDGCLFVSSGQNVVKCMLTLTSEAVNAHKQFKVKVDMEQMSNACISSMWISDTDKTLACQRALGMPLELNVSVPAANGTVSSDYLQPSMKDLLLDISRKQNELAELKWEQQQLDDFLQQMNIASRLLHQEKLQACGEALTPPVACRVELKSDVGYSSVEYFIVVTVTNQSPVALSRDWCLLASVCPVGEMNAGIDHLPCQSHASDKYISAENVPSETGKESGGEKSESTTERSLPLSRGLKPSQSAESTTEHSLPLSRGLKPSQSAESTTEHSLPLSRGLKPSQSASIKVPVLYSPALCGFGVKVSLSLHDADLIQEDEDDNTVRNNLSVPMTSAMIDVIHFLYLNHLEREFPFLTEPGKGFTKKIGAKKTLAGVKCTSEQEPRQIENYSIYIKFSAANKQASLKPEELLKLLLAGGQSEHSSLTQTSCCLHDVYENFLFVSVESVEDEELFSAGCNGSGDDVERRLVVVLKSQNLLLLGKARLAVILRFGTFSAVQRKKYIDDSLKTVTRIIKLQQDLDKWRHRAFGASEAVAEVLKRLSALHQTLQTITI